MTAISSFKYSFIAVGLLILFHSPLTFAEHGIHRDRANISVPHSGMTMEQVEAKFGQAQVRLPSVGQPPITRWEYSGFTVYFEHQRVIHSVIS